MKYFRDVWSYFDIALIAFSFTAFAIWLYRLWEAQRIMTQLSSSNHNGKYVNLQMLAYWDDILSCMLALCAYTASLKFMKILQFNKIIRTLFRTMIICGSEMISFGVLFCLVAFSFIQAGYVIFNDFSTFVKSMETGFLLILGKFQLADMLAANPVFAVIFYIFFNGFVIVVLLNMFISMVSDAFVAAKAEDDDTLHLEDFMYIKLKKMLSIFGAVKGAIDSEEAKMEASLTKKGNYMEPVDNFNYKTNRLVNVLTEVIFYDFIILLSFFVPKRI